MNRHLLLLLFVLLYATEVLRLNPSLAPGLSLKNAFLYLAVAAVAAQVAVTQRHRLELVSVLAPFVLYIAYAAFMFAVPVLVLEYPGYRAWSNFIPLKNGPIEDLMVLLIFFYGLSGTKQPLYVLRGAMWVVIAGSVLTVVDVLNIVNLGLTHFERSGRAAGAFGHPNQFALFMTLCLPLIAALYWTESGYRKTLAGMGLIVCALAFLLAVSRAGIAGLLGGVVLSAILLRTLVPVKLVVKTGLAIACFTIVTLIGLTAAGHTDLLVERIAGTLDGDATYATSGRTAIWARLLGVMMQHPMSFITGFGWNAYQTDFSMGLFRFAPHSTYLSTLYNLGIIGVVLYVIIVVNVVRITRAAIAHSDGVAKPFLIAFMIGFLGLLVAFLVDELYGVSLYVWIIAGALLRVAVSARTPEPASIRTGSYPAPLPYPPRAIQFPRIPHEGRS